MLIYPFVLLVFFCLPLIIEGLYRAQPSLFTSRERPLLVAFDFGKFAFLSVALSYYNNNNISLYTIIYILGYFILRFF